MRDLISHQQLRALSLPLKLFITTYGACAQLQHASVAPLRCVRCLKLFILYRFSVMVRTIIYQQYLSPLTQFFAKSMNISKENLLQAIIRIIETKLRELKNQKDCPNVENDLFSSMSPKRFLIITSLEWYFPIKKKMSIGTQNCFYPIYSVKCEKK